MYSILSFLSKTGLLKSVYAHCDIPCGIYTAEPAQTAARTVARMVELMEELETPDPSDATAVRAYENSMARYVAVKEEHAQICKDQLLILWTDYFKEEHLSAFPELHDTFWKAAKLCSKVKQEATKENAAALEKAVGEIAAIFTEAESAKK